MIRRAAWFAAGIALGVAGNVALAVGAALLHGAARAFVACGVLVRKPPPPPPQPTRSSVWVN